MESQPTTTAFYLKLNSKAAPTDDVHVRRAIAYATDYATIREVIFPGEPMTTVLPAGFADFWNADVTAPTYDMAKAAEEIALSAYAGQEIPITLWPDLSQPGFDVLHPVPFGCGRHLGLDGMGARPGD
jgi:peptide/nickel transport system substrate-binding protein